MSDFRVWHFFCYNICKYHLSLLVIQSEAKDLDNTHVDASEILPPFGRLNDTRRGFLHKMAISFASKLTQNR